MTSCGRGLALRVRSGGDDEEVMYIHCHEMDAVEARSGPGDYDVYGDPGVGLDEVRYEDQIEALCDHFRCDAAL